MKISLLAKFLYLHKILPKKIAFYNSKNIYLLISPNNGKYIICDKIEYMIIKLITLDSQLENIIALLKNEFKVEKIKKIDNIFLNLIKKIKNEKFLEKSKTHSSFSCSKLFIILTYKCNLSCIHCHVARKTLRKDSLISPYRIISLIKNFSKIKTIILTGGEPLLYKNLLRLIKIIKKYKSDINIYLLSNGLQINSKLINEFEKYIQGITISLDGATRNVYEKVRQGGNFGKMKEVLISLSNSSISDIGIEICIMKPNYDDLAKNLLLFLEEIDPNKRFIIDCSTNIILEGRATKDLVLNYRKGINIKKELDNRLIKSGWKIKSQYQFFNDIANKNYVYLTCGIGNQLVLDTDGNIYPCIWLMKDNFKLGNIFATDSIQQIKSQLNNLTEYFDVKNMSPCNECDLRYFCGGSCRVFNKIHNKNMFISECSEIKRQTILKKLFLIWEHKKNKKFLKGGDNYGTN